MFTTSETVGLAEWIIDDTCLVLFWSYAETFRLLNSFTSSTNEKQLKTKSLQLQKRCNETPNRISQKNNAARKKKHEVLHTD